MRGLDGAAGPAPSMRDQDAAPPAEAPHAFLRRVTRPWHERVEAAFECFDLQTRQGLSDFLVRQAKAVCPLETALECTGVDVVLPDWPLRRRGPALMADLARLGLQAPHHFIAPVLPSREHLLGALYVLEGSKLGGRILHRRVLASPDPDVRATTGFLGSSVERGWSGFLAVLQSIDPEAGPRERLKAGADTAFALFEAAAKWEPRQQPAGSQTRSGLYRHAHA